MNLRLVSRDVLPLLLVGASASFASSMGEEERGGGGRKFLRRNLPAGPRPGKPGKKPQKGKKDGPGGGDATESFCHFFNITAADEAEFDHSDAYKKFETVDLRVGETLEGPDYYHLVIGTCEDMCNDPSGEKILDICPLLPEYDAPYCQWFGRTGKGECVYESVDVGAEEAATDDGGGHGYGQRNKENGGPAHANKDGTDGGGAERHHGGHHAGPDGGDGGPKLTSEAANAEGQSGPSGGGPSGGGPSASGPSASGSGPSSGEGGSYEQTDASPSGAENLRENAGPTSAAASTGGRGRRPPQQTTGNSGSGPQQSSGGPGPTEGGEGGSYEQTDAFPSGAKNPQENAGPAKGRGRRPPQQTTGNSGSGSGSGAGPTEGMTESEFTLKPDNCHREIREDGSVCFESVFLTPKYFGEPNNLDSSCESYCSTEEGRAELCDLTEGTAEGCKDSVEEFCSGGQADTHPESTGPTAAAADTGGRESKMSPSHCHRQMKGDGSVNFKSVFLTPGHMGHKHDLRGSCESYCSTEKGRADLCNVTDGTTVSCVENLTTGEGHCEF